MQSPLKSSPLPRTITSKRGFTLIELLIVIAILAILMVTVIITLNPSELLKQSRDTNRLSDMNTLDNALRIASLDSLPMGSSSIVYVSLPDPQATSSAGTNCQGLNLPALLPSYTYHCPASSTYRNTNGQGWLPINFTQVSQGSPLPQLPIDPINSSSSQRYYSYITNGTQYTLTANPESNKFLTSSSTFFTGTSASPTNGIITYTTSTLSGTSFISGTFANTTTTPNIPGLMGYSKNLILIPSTTSYVTTTYALGASSPKGIAFDGVNMWTANYGNNSVAKISPTGVATTYSIGAGTNPWGIAFDGTNMWTANYSDSSVTKISPTGVPTTYGLGGVGSDMRPYTIAFDGINMWTANQSSSSITEISPTGVTTTYSLGAGLNISGIAFDGANMWAVNYSSSSVTEFSPIGTVLGTYTTMNSPYAIAFDGANMCTANWNDVTKISPAGTILANYSVGNGTGPYAIAFDGTNIWTANGGTGSGNTVTKITSLGATTTYTVDTRPSGIAYDGANMWTGSAASSSVTKISPTGVTTTYSVGAAGISPYGIAFDGVNMWTANYQNNSVTKISPTFSSSPGTYTSSPQYLGTVATWGNLSWINQSATGTIIMQARSGSNLSMTNASAWNGTSSCVISSSGSTLSSGNCVTPGDSYIQYQVTLSPAASLAGTPVITSISAGYGK